MSIWHTTSNKDFLGHQIRDTLGSHLDIRFTEIGDDYLRATMPVDEKTRQPYGILHGGASVVLAEEISSLGATLTLDFSKQYCVGLEINANHLRSVRQGLVTGTGKPLHRGRSTQVWQVEIRDQNEQLTCVSRITLAVLDREL